MKTLICCFVSCFIFLFANSSVLAVEKNYQIGSGDVLEISVWKEPDLSRQLVVPPDGVIAFPLIKAVNVANLTVADLKKIIAQRLSEYVPAVTVTVMLLEINSLKAYVIGKVNKAGEFPIEMDTNVMQILAKAGGLNPFASRGGIKILRQNGKKIIKIPFNYGQVERGVNLEQNILLKAGDVVVVP
jgi:polysaccharide export outer membrane protein